MSEEDKLYCSTIINLDISDIEIFRSLSIYFDFRANGYSPEQSHEKGVEKYMETGEVERSKNSG